MVIESINKFVHNLYLTIILKNSYGKKELKKKKSDMADEL